MKNLVIAAVMLCCTIFTAHAQSVKIGYINSLEVVSYMPEAKSADSTLMKLASQLDAQYKTYISEAQAIYAKMQDTSQSEIVLEALSEDLLRAQERIQDFESSSQEKINKKKAELYQPILDKATKAIQDVAKENGYSHVFDSSTGAIVYAPDGDNLINLVKKKLNIN
jgi:outer membrane protein